MAMQSLAQVVERIETRELQIGEPEKKPLVISEQDAQVVNDVFEKLTVIFPAWQRAFPTPETLKAARTEWTKALVQARVVTTQALQIGFKVAREQNIPFFPSPGQFISWCKPTPEMFGLPSVEMALMDVVRHRSTHPAVVLAARSTKWERQTLNAEEYKPVFERAYEQLVRRVMAGEDLNCEVMKALPTKDQIKHSSEFYHEAGQRGLAKLRNVMRGKA